MRDAMTGLTVDVRAVMAGLEARRLIDVHRTENAGER
jgi:hypothetical protein